MVVDKNGSKEKTGWGKRAAGEEQRLKSEDEQRTETRE